MKIAGIAQDSIVDGPGLRLTVFTQGCPHRCPGCHNPQTHDFTGGQEITVEAMTDKLRANPLLDGLTLSGGEPFAQAEECARLAQSARELGLNVWCYTGYTFEELQAAGRPDWKVLLAQVDVLVDGPFLLARRSLDFPWRGSRNQRLLDVPASLAAGAPVSWSKAEIFL